MTNHVHGFLALRMVGVEAFPLSFVSHAPGALVKTRDGFSVYCAVSISALQTTVKNYWLYYSRGFLYNREISLELGLRLLFCDSCDGSPQTRCNQLSRPMRLLDTTGLDIY